MVAVTRLICTLIILCIIMAYLSIVTGKMTKPLIYLESSNLAQWIEMNKLARHHYLENIKNVH